jgi:hypothetical protein
MLVSFLTLILTESVRLGSGSANEKGKGEAIRMAEVEKGKRDVLPHKPYSVSSGLPAFLRVS